MSKHWNNALTVLIYGLALLFIYDYVMANGGYPKVLSIYCSPEFPLIYALIILGYKGILALTKQQWKSLFLNIALIIITIIGTNSIIPKLAEKSKDRAYQQVKEFILTKNTNKYEVQFWGEKDLQVDNDFQSFMRNPDMSAVKFQHAIIPFGRYVYNVSPNSSRPFQMTFIENTNLSGGKIMLDITYEQRRAERNRKPTGQ